MADRRVQFDFDIEFSNGGSLTGRGVPARHRGRRHRGPSAGRLRRPRHAPPDGGRGPDPQQGHPHRAAQADRRAPARGREPRGRGRHDHLPGAARRPSFATTGPARSPAATSRRARSSTSAGSTWWRTRARTSTARSTAMPMARTWRRSRSSRWPTFPAWWSARPAGRSAGSTSPRSPGWTSGGRRCSCTRAGTGHWRTDRYFEGHPFLTAAGAEWLAGQGAALVGIDSLNIDDTADGRRPAHSTLLRHEHPDRRAPVRSRPPARRGLPLLRRAGEGARVRDVSGPRLRGGLAAPAGIFVSRRMVIARGRTRDPDLVGRGAARPALQPKMRRRADPKPLSPTGPVDA